MRYEFDGIGAGPQAADVSRSPAVASKATPTGSAQSAGDMFVFAAKAKAETQLAQAVKLMESWGAKELVARVIRAENVILLAGRLTDARG